MNRVPRKLQSCNRQRGISLVELTITVLIMGILAAAALPRFASAMAKLQGEAVARRIASDLNFARRTAIQTSRKTTITFATSPPGYAMTGVTNPAYPTQQYAVKLSDVDSWVSIQTASFDGGPTLTYNAYGRPLVGTTALASGVIVLKSGSFNCTVNINPATGEANIQ